LPCGRPSQNDSACGSFLPSTKLQGVGKFFRQEVLTNLFGSFSGEWMPPAQAGKLFMIAVGGHTFAAGLNGKGGKPDIGNQIARGQKRLAQPGENLPVAGTRRD
jgi:hypothetical protein